MPVTPPQGKPRCLQLLNHSFRKVSVQSGRAGDRVWSRVMSILTLPVKQQLPRGNTRHLNWWCQFDIQQHSCQGHLKGEKTWSEIIFLNLFCFFFSLCWKWSVSPCLLHSHTSSYQLNSFFFHMFSMVLVWIATQLFRLLFKNYLFQFMQICISDSEFHIWNIKTALKTGVCCTI